MKTYISVTVIVRRWVVVLMSTVLWIASDRAMAQTCETGTLPAALHYLRRLSLDLRGRVPDVGELYSVATNGAVGPDIVDGMLTSEEFVAQVREYHRELLWANVLSQRLSQTAWNLRAPASRQRPSPAYWLPAVGRARGYRGAVVPCADETARFDPQTGAILTTPDPSDPSIHREGWVEVTPYWDETKRVRVCAFDAQETASVPDPRGGSDIDCSRQTNPRCGCGPNLSYCQSPDDRTGAAIASSLNEQMLRFVDNIVRSDRPYTEVILGKELEINGPISHWLRFQTGAGGNLVFALPGQNYVVPSIPFQEVDRWTKVTRGARHAGVLSMPVYLLKFQSERGRANRFYNAFLCRHFEAPPGGLPAASDECHDEPDLTKRCGCQYCHVTVEPAAAYWGRWAEAGVAPLEQAQFPKYLAECDVPAGRALPPGCRLLYFTNAGHPKEEPYLGMLKAYVFADAQREENIASGPAGIAQVAVDSGAFAECTTRKMWTRLMHRAPTPAEDGAIQALAASFKNGYSLRSLIRSIIEAPEYVEAGRFERPLTSE